jgi:hypothetical protein
VNVNYQYDGIYMNLLRSYREAWAEVWELEQAVIDHGYSPQYVGPVNEARDRFADIKMRVRGRERMLFGPDFGE